MASDVSTRRRGIVVNLAFVYGIVGAVLVLVGATMPQLRVPGIVMPPLFEPGAPGLDSGTMVAVFALFAIAFCLSRRYRWLAFCALVIIVFLAAALTYQLTGMLGLTIRQIVDMHNGVLPPGLDPQVLLAKLPMLENTTWNVGLPWIAAGLLLMESAPWLRRLSFHLGGRASGAAQSGRLVQAADEPQRRWPMRREPRAMAAPAFEESRAQVQATLARPLPAAPAPLQAGDLLLDGLYVFAEGLDQPLTFSLLDPSGRVTRHRMRMQAAGYLGDAYYLRCRDIDAGNLRDVPAHMMTDIVDDVAGQPIDTDDMLQDLARAAHEAVSGEITSSEEGETNPEVASSDGDRAPDSGLAEGWPEVAQPRAESETPLFRVEVTPAADGKIEPRSSG